MGRPRGPWSCPVRLAAAQRGCVALPERLCASRSRRCFRRVRRCRQAPWWSRPTPATRPSGSKRTPRLVFAALLAGSRRGIGVRSQPRRLRRDPPASPVATPRPRFPVAQVLGEGLAPAMPVVLAQLQAFAVTPPHTLIRAGLPDAVEARRSAGTQSLEAPGPVPEGSPTSRRPPPSVGAYALPRGFAWSRC